MRTQFGMVKRRWLACLVQLCVVGLWCGVTLGLANAQDSKPAQKTVSSAAQRDAPLDLNSPLPDPPSPLPIGESEQPMAGPFFNELMRREALLAAKLKAVLSKPTDGSHQALRELLGQMQALRVRAMEQVGAGLDVEQKRMQEARLRYALHDEERQADPYALLADHLERHPALLSVVSEVLDRGFSGEASCPYPLGHDARWLSEKRLPLVMTDVLWRLQKGANLYRQCLNGGHGAAWRWLQRGETPQARALRDGYVAMVEQMQRAGSAWVILDNLPEAGRLCSSPVPRWATDMCQRWQETPQSVDMLALLPMGAHGPALDYEAYRPSFERLTNRFNDQRVLLDGLVKSNGAGVQPWRNFVAQATQHRWRLSELTIWAHPKRRDALIEVHLYDANGNYEGLPRGKQDGRQIWRISSEQSTRLELPRRLYQPGAGLARVTDLRGDGLLQLWHSQEGRCQENEDDVWHSDLHCRLMRGDMLQLEGNNTLSHFRSDAQVPTGQLWGSPNAGLTRWMNAKHQRSDKNETNLRLWGTLLAEPTGLDFGNNGERGDRGNILSFASKPYPTDPTLTLVTLYHSWPQVNAEGSTAGQEPDANNLDDVGFLVLLVDTVRKKVLRRYAGREVVDAGVRIHTNSLTLDTARYLLAPGVRAFGVRKGIGYSPCAAVGWSTDFLTLFVEDGNDAFRPILEDLAMRQGNRLQGDSCGGPNQPEIIWEDVRLVLSVEPTRHEGWADLKVTAIRNRDAGGTPDSMPAQRDGRVGTLQRQGGRYVCKGGCDPFAPR